MGYSQMDIQALIRLHGLPSQVIPQVLMLIDIYLPKNSMNISESRTVSEYTGSSGRVWDLGSNNMVRHLDRGDAIELFSNDCSVPVWRLKFCVELS